LAPNAARSACKAPTPRPPACAHPRARRAPCAGPSIAASAALVLPRQPW
jgi:hypothetical protein